MVEDNPIQNELVQMALFCEKYKKIYILGSGNEQQYLSKYFRLAQIPIEGYLEKHISTDKEHDREVFSFDDIVGKKNREIGVIIIDDEEKIQEIKQELRTNGINNTFEVSQWNRRTIVYKMTPRSKKNFLIEVNLADHCNLNCQCCDHFSPIASKEFLDFDQYVKDLNRLSDLTDNEIGLIKLQGGEPLLNDRLIDYIRVTREVFPNAFICLFTAGLLLEKWSAKPSDGSMNLWEAVKEYEIEIRWTRYPINLRFDKIKGIVEEYGIEWWEDAPPFEKGARVWLFSEIGALKYKGEKHSVKHPFWLEGGILPYRWISCYQFNESIVLRDGKIYTCPMIPYVHFFNERFNQNLVVGENDYIDIYDVDSYEEIAEFCTHRTDFCGYCAVHHRKAYTWKQSSHTIDEWIEVPPFYGDRSSTVLSKIDLIKIGFDSLKKDGISKTWERTKNALKK